VLKIWRTIFLWLRRALGVAALALAAALLVGVSGTGLQSLREGASVLMLLPMLGIALTFILPLLLVAYRCLQVRVDEQAKPAKPANRTPSAGNWKPGMLLLLVVVALVMGARQWFLGANEDLFALHSARLSDLAAIRPAVQRYRTEQGRYPPRLVDLVPGYLPQLPASLVNRPEAESVTQLSYHADRDGAWASFNRHRGPDSRVEYDFANGALKYNE
jgi:hypothetical protein